MSDNVIECKTVVLPAKVSVLADINRLLEETLTGELAVNLFKTQLVVEELLANICSYAYDGKEGEAKFACGVVNFDGKHCIMIQLTDNGKPYDPFANALEPSLDESVNDREIGGLGVYLVREIASHYIYLRVDGCNQTQIILDIDQHNFGSNP